MTQDKLSEEGVWPLGGYAPGGYMCKCAYCEKVFEGDKRAFQCLECAVKSAKIALRSATPMPEPFAWCTTDVRGRLFEASSLRGDMEAWDAVGLQVTPLYTTPPAREISEAERVRSALADLVLLIDLFDASDRTADDALHILALQSGTWATARAALEAARSPS